MTLFTRQDMVESKRVYDGHIINLRVDTVRTPDGQKALRELVEHPGGVVIAAQPHRDKVILIRQYRYSVDEELIELPAGRIEIGEEPMKTAMRELIEETGYQGQQWSELSRMYSAPGFCNEMLYFYLAADLNFVGKKLDHDEETEVMILNVQEAWQLVTSGKVRDAKTIAGLGLLAASGRSA